MTEQTTSKPWYKKWWGVILTIAFFPFVVPYLVWTKTTWNKWVKIAITAFCAIIVISSMIDSSQRKQESLDLVNQAEIFINENKISDALTVLDKSQELNTVKSENPAFELEEKITKLQSSEFLKKTLADMSDSDFDLLKKGELKTSFINHDGLNKLFLTKLQENADQRAVYIAEVEELRKKEQEEAEKKKLEEEAKARTEMIEKQFSAWDGSHIKLTRLIKDSMNDPDSYEHVETKYWDMKDHLIINATFRGKNAFGGVVKNTVKAKVSLDGENIEILEQY